MKKIILTAALFIAAFAQAQVIEVYDDEVQIVNDATYTYTTIGAAAKLHLQVINVSANSINVKLKMLAIENNASGEEVQFCFGENCYAVAPVNTTAPQQTTGITIAPDSDNGPAQYFYNNQNVPDIAGQPIKYTLGIIQVDANGAQIGEPLIKFNYVYSPTAATTDFASLQQMGISVNSTVVKNTLDVTASQNAKLELININGQSVKKAVITNGSQSIDLSGLSSAVYFAKFTNEENKTAQIKIVKN